MAVEVVPAGISRARTELVALLIVGVLAGVAFSWSIHFASIEVEGGTMLGRLVKHPLIRGQAGLFVGAVLYWSLWSLLAHRSLVELQRMCLAERDDARRRRRVRLSVAEMENRLAPLSYVAWLLPVTGFVGTVYGLIFAIQPLGRLVGSAGAGAVDTSAIVGVLDGLYVAFDTTLVGLLGAIPVMALLQHMTVAARRAEAELTALMHVTSPPSRE